MTFKLTIDGVSTTALADVILTGCVLEVRAETTGHMCTVTIQATKRETLDILTEALLRRHDPSKVLRPSELIQRP